MSNSNTTQRSSIDSNTNNIRPSRTPSKSEHADTPPLFPISTSSINYSRPLARERPYARNETANSSNGNSRPPSIRSATSFGRPLGRFATGQHARHQSTYSNFSTMSETTLPWTTKDIGFNAISGVLNDPAKPKDFTKPSKGDIPPVAHASISRIKPSHFEAYLNHIGSAYERYHYNKQQSPSNSTTTTTAENTSTLETEEEEAAAALLSPQSPSSKQPKRTGRNPYSLPQHVLSSESLLDDDQSNSAKGSPRDLPMLENVPSIFFEPDFLLENPQVFDTVCEGADIVGNTGPNPPTSTNSILQEKLSYYLDTVEVHLLREIENRSSSFFEALSNLQALHQQTLDCVSQIHTIRQKMKQIQETECKDGLEIIRLQVRKKNLERLYRATKTIRDIRATQPMIQALLGQGDYFAALDLIEETKSVLNKRGQKDTTGDEDDIDLSSIKALANFSAQLDEMQKAVGVMTQHDFLSILLSDFTFTLENLDLEQARRSLLTLATTKEETQLDLDQERELRDRMKPSTVGLLRTDMLLFTLREYRERLMVEIKDIIRNRYPESVLSSTVNTSQEDQINYQLSKQLRSMPFSTFFDMLLNVFSTLMKAIQRASVYHQLIVSLAPDQPELEKESADIVFSAADLAHVRCGKLISFRNDQNALLNPTDFYRLSNVIRAFVVQCELMCKRTCFGLRGTMTAQQKAFIEHFHMERVKQEAQLIENEQWIASEVPSDFQLIVDDICDGHIAYDSTNRQSQKEEKPTKHLVLDGHSYYVVGCSLLILKMFEDYLKCAFNLDNPVLTAEIIHRLMEMLKLFNSRVCQVILGAGAMRSAGLKNITAKHLALASQSLAVMIALIPKLKRCMAQQLVSKQSDGLLSEFDRTVEDYRNHQGEIHAKLVAIMNERFAAHAKAMQAIDWDQEDSETGKNANVYMETLVTETVRLHKVLSKYLPVQELKSIMSQVFQSFTTRLSDQITNTVIKTERGKSRLRRDIVFFNHRLGLLHQADPPSDAALEAVDTLVIQDAS